MLHVCLPTAKPSNGTTMYGKSATTIFLAEEQAREQAIARHEWAVRLPLSLLQGKATTDIYILDSRIVATNL